MPKTTVVFYKDDYGDAPVVQWLRNLKGENEKAFRNCVAAIKDLETYGHELRRPTADALRDGIRELRSRHGQIQYRILYFFNGKDFAVVAHAIVKKGSVVPDDEIERSLKRKLQFERNPTKHTWIGDSEDA